MPLRAPKGFIDETDPRVCLIGHPAPAWLVNYADLMTELVCFFVILYALSAALDKKVAQASQEVKDMKETGVSARIDREGLKITLEESGQNVFFESGSAELTPEMERLMSKVSPVLRKLLDTRDIIVEGHTDNVPIKNDLYLNNWELSSARATNVVQYMINAEKFPPGRMAAMGYGEHRPLAPNDSRANRARNRRVVFFVKNTPPGGGGASRPADAPKAASAGPAPPAVEVGSLSGAGATGFFDRVLSGLKSK